MFQFIVTVHKSAETIQGQKLFTEIQFVLSFKRTVPYSCRSSHFWLLLAKKLQKYYVIFVYILQDKIRWERQKKNRKENHTTKVTKMPKTKTRKYGMKETLLTVND